MLPKHYLPELHSNFSDPDALFGFIFWLNVIFFLIILIPTVAFFVMYRHKGGKTKLTPGITHNTVLEIFWTVVPTIIIFFIFWWGFKGYMNYWIAPKNAYVIQATARQWGWTFTYQTPEGDTFQTTDLVVPHDRPVKMIMTSTDVIHSFYIPDFRVKMDVLPRRKTSLWFTPITATGVYSEETSDNVQPLASETNPDGTYFDLYCTEYCGTRHSKMQRKVHVLPEADFQAWVEKQAKPSGPLWEIGAKLYKTLSCNTCHAVDSDAMILGPSWLNQYGTEREVIDENGQTMTVVMDREYIHESIVAPNAKIVAAVGDKRMNMIDASEPQIEALTAYIASLNQATFNPEDWGTEPAEGDADGAATDTAPAEGAMPSPDSTDTNVQDPTEPAPTETEGM